MHFFLVTSKANLGFAAPRYVISLVGPMMKNKISLVGPHGRAETIEEGRKNNVINAQQEDSEAE